MEGDLQTTEDYLQTMEDDRVMIEDDQNFPLQTNKASLNPFECSEMIDEVNWTEDDLQPLEDDLQTTRYVGRCPIFFVSFKLTKTV